jgi:hypothetical protein
VRIVKVNSCYYSARNGGLLRLSKKGYKQKDKNKKDESKILPLVQRGFDSSAVNVRFGVFFVR